MLIWLRDKIFGKPVVDKPAETTPAVVQAPPAPVINTQITDAVTVAPVVVAGVTGSLAATSMTAAASVKPKKTYKKKNRKTIQ